MSNNPNWKRQLEKWSYDKQKMNKKIINIKNSMDEISKLLNTNKKTKR